nr:major head protein [Microvirus sp.]
MNVNKANHYVSTVETTTKRLNKFYQPHGLHTTFDSGKLIPIYIKEVLPNDVRKLKWSAVTRLLTPKFPTMDNAKLDTFFFYVRNRDIWNHWQEFMGYSPSQWISSSEYEIPKLTIPLSPQAYRYSGDLADYLGIPIVKGATPPSNVVVNALPFRAVCKVWNDYFRDENYQDETYFPLDETPLSYKTVPSNSSALTYVDGISTGNICPPVNRYKDYFSSCLPAPQKGQPVTLPLGDYAPVVDGLVTDVGTSLPASFKVSTAQSEGLSVRYNGKYSPSSSPVLSTPVVYSDTSGVTPGNGEARFYLRADLQNATAASVNALRLAFQTQRFLELSARGGTRYTELLQSMFGVNAPDLMLNRAEFLGGKSFPLSLTPVTNVGSDLGSVGGMSNTVSGDYAFKKHFNEHGYIIGFACVRTDRSYSQGIEPLWFRSDKTDFYFPVFSHIGEQPVLKREIFANGVKANDEAVWGYKEAWTEYRVSLNKCSGYMRSGITNTLNVWTYTDDYSASPVLNSAWLTSQKEIIDRTIVNPNEMQFLADFYFDDTLYSVVSKNSAPGLIDHY